MQDSDLESEGGGDDDDAVSALQQALDDCETALVGAEERNDAALETLAEVEEEAGELARSEAKAKGDRDRAQDEVDEIEALPEFATLSEDLNEASAELARRAVELDQAKRNAEALDVDTIDRRIKQLDTHRQKTHERKLELEREIMRLEARIESEGGQGLAERTAAARDELEAANSALDRMTNEADTLSLLRTVLAQAREEMSQSLVGPVAQRARKYTQRILPGSDPVFGGELELASLRRSGNDETIEWLSKGTQEQLSLLARLGFAELLQDEGYPVSLMLDDPLAYSDDYRLNATIDVLHEFSQKMQVIVLTCRERAFRTAPGNRIAMSQSQAAA